MNPMRIKLQLLTEHCTVRLWAGGIHIQTYNAYRHTRAENAMWGSECSADWRSLLVFILMILLAFLPHSSFSLETCRFESDVWSHLVPGPCCLHDRFPYFWAVVQAKSRVPFNFDPQKNLLLSYPLLCFYLRLWICCRVLLDPRGNPSAGSLTQTPARSLFSSPVNVCLHRRQHIQQDLATPLPLPACMRGSESREGTTENILPQIKLMVSTAEIARQMSFSVCTQRGDGVGGWRWNRKNP